MEVTEDNEETAIVLEKEIEFEILQSRSKIDKRKNDESGKPPNKRKKLGQFTIMSQPNEVDLGCYLE